MNKKILLLALGFSILLLPGCFEKKVIYGPGSSSVYRGGSQDAYSGNSSGTAIGGSGTAIGSSGSATGAGGTPISGEPTTATGQRGTTPYTVLGKTYYPMLSVDSYSEEGIASWYGADFHGKQTANGERYDMNGMTAAHKLLPFGTMLKVTSLENGKSVTVRVNDRGPFVENRIIDLTRSAASGLDMLGPGTARVRIETIGAVSGLSKGELSGSFYVQIGAFSKEDNALGLVQALADRGTKARSYYSSHVNMWRVQVGPYSNLSGSERAADSLRGEYPLCFIIAD
jgi:rare lipoprotein A